MDGAAGILALILGIALAIFLVLAIILMVLLIRVTTQIKHITESAERTVHKVEDATQNVSRFAIPVAIVSTLRNIVSKKK